MLKLLTANAVQVLRNKAFWSCLAFTAVGTAVLVVSTFNMLDYNGLVNRWTAEASLFCMLPGIGIINAIFIHLTIGSDYDQGTIRSKLACGHTRAAVYAAHALTSTAAALCVLAASLILSSALSWHLFRAILLTPAELALLMLDCILLTLAYAAMSVALAMNLSHKATSAVVGLLFMIALSIVASMIDTTMTDIIIYGNEAHPLTVAIIRFLYDFLPSAQCIQINNQMFDHMARWPIYSLLLTIAATFLGYLLFRKKDIK